MGLQQSLIQSYHSSTATIDTATNGSSGSKRKKIKCHQQSDKDDDKKLDSSFSSKIRRNDDGDELFFVSTDCSYIDTSVTSINKSSSGSSSRSTRDEKRMSTNYCPHTRKASDNHHRDDVLSSSDVTFAATNTTTTTAKTTAKVNIARVPHPGCHETQISPSLEHSSNSNASRNYSKEVPHICIKVEMNKPHKNGCSTSSSDNALLRYRAIKVMSGYHSFIRPPHQHSSSCSKLEPPWTQHLLFHTYAHPARVNQYVGFMRHAPPTTSKKHRSCRQSFGKRKPKSAVAAAAAAAVAAATVTQKTATATAGGGGAESSSSSSLLLSSSSSGLAVPARDVKVDGLWEGYERKYECNDRGFLDDKRDRMQEGVRAGGEANYYNHNQQHHKQQKQQQQHVQNSWTTDTYFTSYSFCRWFEVSPSHGLFQLDSSSSHRKKFQDTTSYSCPVDAFDILNKLAYWFLFPIANDAVDMDTDFTSRYLGEMDVFQGLTCFFSSMLRKVFQVDFSHSIGTTFQDESSLCQEQQQQQQQQECNSDIYAHLRASHDNPVQLHPNRKVTDSSCCSHDIPQAQVEPNHLLNSISSIDSDEVICSSSTATASHSQQRYLDIECILRLPTMTYDEEGSSSDGFVGSIDTYDTDGGKSVKVGQGAAGGGGVNDHDETGNDKDTQYNGKEEMDDDNSDSHRGGVNTAAAAATTETEISAQEIGSVAPSDHRAMGLEWSWITVPKQQQGGPSSQSMESMASMVVVEEQESAKEEEEDQNKEENHGKAGDQCVICLEKFQKGDKLCILPCHHPVHTSCVDKWLCGSISREEECSMDALCPVCKSPLGAPNDPFPSSRGGSMDCLQSVKSMVSDASLVEYMDDDSMQSMILDGFVPSWAFERLGSKIAKK